MIPSYSSVWLILHMKSDYDDKNNSRCLYIFLSVKELVRVKRDAHTHTHTQRNSHIQITDTHRDRGNKRETSLIKSIVTVCTSSYFLVYTETEEIHAWLCSY